MNKKLLKLVFLIFVLTTLTSAMQATAAPEAKTDDGVRLLRFPAVYNNQVVFSYAGDLYTVGTEGGVARKLTNHSGYEMFPRFSPDGKHIAFTAQYDGNTEVYLMDAMGSVPKRLTYTATLGRDDVSDRMGPNNLVMGWTPDNKHIVFRSRMIEIEDLGFAEARPIDPLKKYYVQTELGEKIAQLLLKFFDDVERSLLE